MNKYNSIRNISHVVSLLLFSTIVHAEEAAPQVAGSWFAILPPLLTIAVALMFKRVVPALFLGIWMGAWAINDFGLFGLWTGLLDTFQVYVANALSKPDHAAIVLFSMMVGGMVGNHFPQWWNAGHRQSHCQMGRFSPACLSRNGFFGTGHIL